MQSPVSAKNLLFRQIGSIVYDSMILLSVLWLATIPWLFLTEGESIPKQWTAHYRIYLLMTLYFYFVFSWTRGGQTVGMRPWKLYLVNENQQKPELMQASLRFMAGILSCLTLGLGFLMVLLPGNRSLHDRLSGTHLVHREKPL